MKNEDYLKKKFPQRGVPSGDLLFYSSYKARADALIHEWEESSGMSFEKSYRSVELDNCLAALFILSNTISYSRPFVDRMFKYGEVQAERLLEPIFDSLEHVLSCVSADIEHYKKQVEE